MYIGLGFEISKIRQVFLKIFIKTPFEIEVKMLAYVYDIVSIFLGVGGPGSLNDGFLMESYTFPDVYLGASDGPV